MGEGRRSDGVGGICCNWGNVTGELVGDGGGNASGSSINGCGSGLRGVHGLPRVFFCSIDGFSLVLSDLVDHGTGVVHGVHVSVDGGALDVTVVDG